MHKILGHCQNETKQKIAKHLGWGVNHSLMSLFESCANTKANLKNVTKSSGSEKTNFDSGRIYSDIMTIKLKDGEETMLRNNWHIKVDERLGHKISNLITQNCYDEAIMCSI